jgi:hypothetical protein
MKTEQRENLFVNLIFNLGLPILILRKGDDWFGEILGVWMSLSPESTEVSSCLLALAVFFPVSYGMMQIFLQMVAKGAVIPIVLPMALVAVSNSGTMHPTHKP